MNVVAFDLEATCWKERGQNNVSEIIEIGAVKFNKKTCDIVGEFNVFIKPEYHPKLSPFCKELTSITQDDVDNGISYTLAMDSYNEFIGDDTDWLFSWGQYDKNAIVRESIMKKYNSTLITKLEEKHHNLKKVFAGIMHTKEIGLDNAIKRLNLVFEGTHHRGIDDSKNVMRIYSKIKENVWRTIL